LTDSREAGKMGDVPFEAHVFNRTEGCLMAVKKPVKQRKAKDLDVVKSKASEKVKGGARVTKSELIKLQ
jgi:hypothetical protein